MSGTFSVSFMKFAGIPPVTTSILLLFSRIFQVVGIFISGPLADLLKRRVVAYSAIAITTILSYPFALAVLGKRVLLIAILQSLITFFGVGLLDGLSSHIDLRKFPDEIEILWQWYIVQSLRHLGRRNCSVLLGRTDWK